MKKSIMLAFVLACFTAGTALAKGEFTLSSPAIKDKGVLPMEQVLKGFGCDGGNVSPCLEWNNPPAGTQSFALTVYDPDAPTGSGWWHWVVFDIPADTSALELNAGNPATANTAPGFIQSVTDFGAPGFGGACPPEGDKPHRYVFTLHALSVPSLGLDAKAMPAMVGFNLNANSLGKASFTATFGR